MKFLTLEKVIIAICCVVVALNSHAAVSQPAPTLILTDTRLAELKELARTDAVLRGYVADVIKRADMHCSAAALQHKLIGPRLLSVSRDMLSRTYTLGLAYRWTGDRKYLDAEVDDLRTVCDFPDWNPSHFLDVAEMTHAVAIGYDWLRRDLTPELREKVRKKLIELGVGDGAKRIREKDAWWINGRNNWTQVCCSGLIVGALAVRDTNAELWEELREPLLAALRKANKLYAPDGAWHEGAGYWHYATSYLVYALAALETSLGSDMGLSSAEGFDVAARFPVYMSSPTGGRFCFADDHLGRKVGANGELFWMARHFNMPDVLAYEHRQAQATEARPTHVIWYAPPPPTEPAFARSKQFRGRVPVAVMRSAWNDSNAWWVAVKAGDNMVSHGHLDLGSFEFEADGVRWASDLGSDDYNLRGYFGKQRWDYYRLQTVSHNVFTLDGINQSPDGTSQMTEFKIDGNVTTAMIDLVGAYTNVKQAVRTISFDRSNLLFRVTDALMLAEKHNVTWGMTTAAEIEINGNAAVMKIGKHLLHAKIESPAGAAFSVGSCEQAPPQEDNQGYRRLEVKLVGVSGDQKIVVKFSR